MKTAWVALMIAFGIFLFSVTQAHAKGVEIYVNSGGNHPSFHDQRRYRHYGPHSFDRYHDYRPSPTFYYYSSGHHPSNPVIFRRPVYVTPVIMPPAYTSGAEIRTIDSTVNATPVSASYIDASGQTCREYQSSVLVGGAVEQAYGTACLQPDGSWRVTR